MDQWYHYILSIKKNLLYTVIYIRSNMIKVSRIITDDYFNTTDIALWKVGLEQPSNVINIMSKEFLSLPRSFPMHSFTLIYTAKILCNISTTSSVTQQQWQARFSEFSLLDQLVLWCEGGYCAYWYIYGFINPTYMLPIAKGETYILTGLSYWNEYKALTRWEMNHVVINCICMLHSYSIHP